GQVRYVGEQKLGLIPIEGVNPLRRRARLTARRSVAMRSRADPTQRPAELRADVVASLRVRPATSVLMAVDLRLESPLLGTPAAWSVLVATPPHEGNAVRYNNTLIAVSGPHARGM